MSYHTILRSNIRAELARRDWLVQEGAAAIGMQPSMFSSRLHGRTEWRMSELVGLASALGIPVSKLLDGVDDGEAVPA